VSFCVIYGLRSIDLWHDSSEYYLTYYLTKTTTNVLNNVKKL